MANKPAKNKKTVKINLEVSNKNQTELRCTCKHEHTNLETLRKFLKYCKEAGIVLSSSTELSLCKAFLFATDDHSQNSHNEIFLNRKDWQLQ